MKQRIRATQWLPKLLVRMVLIAWFSIILYWISVNAFRHFSSVDYDASPSDAPSLPTIHPPNEADLAVQQGYEWARQNNIASHSSCKAETKHLVAMGCDRYVTEQKHIPPTPTGYDRYATTRHCVAAMHAYYDPLFQDMIEQGQHRAVSVWTHKRMEPDLKSCNNIDNIRSPQAIYEPMERLTALLKKAQQGTPLTDDDLDVVRKDYPGVTGFREHEKRNQYLATAAQLFSLAGGKSRFFPLAPPSDENLAQVCGEYETRINALKAEAHQAGEQLSDAQQSDAGSATRQTQEELVRRQNKILNEWSELAVQSKVAGCYKAGG